MNWNEVSNFKDLKNTSSLLWVEKISHFNETLLSSIKYWSKINSVPKLIPFESEGLNLASNDVEYPKF